MYLILYKIKCQQLYVHFGQPISDILPIDFSQKILYSSLYIFFVSFRYPPKEKLSGQLLVVLFKGFHSLPFCNQNWSLDTMGN